MSVAAAEQDRQDQNRQGRHRLPAVLAELAVLRETVDRLADTPAWPLDDDELAAAVETVSQEIARLEAIRLSLVREVDGRDLAGRVEATSTGALLRERLRIRPGQARGLVDLAAALDGPLAATGAALAAGTISVDQAQAIMRAVLGLPASVDAGTRTGPSGSCWSRPPSSTPAS